MWVPLEIFGSDFLIFFLIMFFPTIIFCAL
jgi:hypothetical protein